ncbi:unnamed protein product [Sphagnum jensenii]|uniref:Secreted protein n=1 Tax=Sphagnum jensenii TaxID=128206 RepID=A0ABP1BMI4_9BRYO
MATRCCLLQPLFSSTVINSFMWLLPPFPLRFPQEGEGTRGGDLERSVDLRYVTRVSFTPVRHASCKKSIRPRDRFQKVDIPTNTYYSAVTE